MNKLERASRPGFRTVSLAAAVLLGCCIFPAVADDGKQRYVAGSGRDQGDCLNRFRPCRSLSYAISKAGKADIIKVAEGSYTVRDTQQLYDVLSVNGRINAGFSKVSSYSERNATPDTVLVGVPPEFRERFEAAGFTVITDRKGLDISREESAQMSKLSAQITASEQSHAAAPCTGNSSGGFPCQAVSLGTHLSLQALTPAGTRGNSVWGFTDLNTGREYAFMGLENGVAVVDLSNPDAAEQVGASTGSATTWRDIKVYQTYDASARRWRAYAYVTADRVTDFLMVLDLSGLPNSVERVNLSSDHRSAHNVYMINADYTFGLAQTGDGPQLGIAGSNLNTGNFRLYSLTNPRIPQLLSVATFGYAHDLSSFAVKDARKNTQCVNAQSQPQCQVLSDFNENTVDIWDITNPGSPQRLASQPYANAAYVHSGWWTEDGRFLLVHDELDEQNFSLNTTIRVFDLADLRAPVLAGSWVGPTRAIDHNGYVKGNRYYVANYSEGLTVLDITDPVNPTRIGFFDTFPASAQTGFVGAWAAYPFYPSGAIAIGDINSGLYIVRNETLATPRGSFAMANAALAGTEGQALTVNVNRNGGGTGAVSVDLEVLYATADATDASIASTTLSWAAGDTQAKSAAVNLAADGQSAERLELLLVRLKNPQGGATVGYPDTTHVSVAESGSSATLRLLDSAPAIDEARAKAFVTLTRHGSASGEVRASYRTVAGGTYNGVTDTQGELVWADGDASGKVVTVPLNPTTLSAGQSGTFRMEFFNAVSASLEQSDGTAIAVLPLTVTVNDVAAAPPPPPPPQPPAAPPRSGGGGGTQQLWLSLLVALLAAGRALFGQAAFAADTTEELTRQVREAETGFAKTMADRDLEAFGKFLADDAVFFGPSGALQGKAAVVEAWKGFYQGKDAPFSWKPENVEIASSGTLAHSSGPVLDPQGKHVATFNSVWRREADGTWKVVFDKGCNVCNCKP